MSTEPEEVAAIAAVMQIVKPPETKADMMTVLQGVKPVHPAEECPTDRWKPTWLKAEGATLASSLWDKYAPMAWKMGTFKEQDVEMFGAFCNAMANMQKAQANVDKYGPVTKSHKTGGAVVSPFFVVVESSMNIAIKFAQQFGFTAAARAKIEDGENDKAPKPTSVSVQVHSQVFGNRGR